MEGWSGNPRPAMSRAYIQCWSSVMLAGQAASCMTGWPIAAACMKCTTTLGIRKPGKHVRMSQSALLMLFPKMCHSDPRGQRICMCDMARQCGAGT